MARSFEMSDRDDAVFTYNTAAENMLPEVFRHMLAPDPETKVSLMTSPIDQGQKLGEEITKELFKFEGLVLNREEEEGMVARKENINTHRNSVAIIGQSAVGKSKLVKDLAEKIQNKVCFKEAKVVFYLEMGDVNFSAKQAFTSFVLTFIPISCMHREFTNEDVEQLKQGEGCIMVFDNFNDAHTDAFKKNDDIPSSFDDRTPDIHIKNMLLGRIFPAAAKILTSRRQEFFELHPRFRPPYIVTCTGINHAQGHMNICKKNCVSQREIRLVMEFLETHPEFDRVCHIPLICVATVDFLRRNVKTLSNSDAIILPKKDAW